MSSNTSGETGLLTNVSVPGTWVYSPPAGTAATASVPIIVTPQHGGH
jgi:hypothetical protein